MPGATRYVVAAGAIVLAIAWGGFGWSPYQLAQTVKHHYRVSVTPGFHETPRYYRDIPVEALLSIRSAADVGRMRGELIRVLWGHGGIPSALPTVVALDAEDQKYGNFHTQVRLEKITVAMEFGLVSQVYHFKPAGGRNKVILYHEGHDGDFEHSRKQISDLLQKGYSVLAFAMPLLGRNPPVTLDLPRIGRMTLTRHDQMKYLQPTQGHPVKYFVEPVVVAINHLARHYNYDTISMVGISGGGWTTTMAAAVDPRIVRSFPVAGSVPLFLRSHAPQDWGDYEQTVPEVYQAVNYLELYVLGAHGLGRRQLQVLNQFDPCCFYGTKSETYRETVKKRVQALGSGKFDLWLDTTHRRHAISDAALARILAEIEDRD